MASKLKINALLIFLVILLLILLAANAAGQQASDFGLIIPAAVQEYWQTHEPDSSEFNSNMLPLALDWSSFDSEVKNQLNCGSCWAFAAVALIENISRKNDLSEQVVISCTAGGCSGGWYGDALKYASDFGVPPEECYEYLATNGNCDDKCSQPEYLVFLSSYDYYGRWGTPNQSTIGRLKELLQNGPVCASMLVPADGTFESYSVGVYDYEGGEISSNRGHAILVVGYNENEQYFKAKNSWGSNWGEDGYFRITYDDVTDDVQFGGYACTASGAFVSESVPVELAVFKAEVIANSVRLLWTTVSECENYGFDVERSQDGVNFQKVQFIKGYGTTTVEQSYSFVDEGLSVGKYYYRLKQIDFDGRSKFSELIAVEVASPNVFRLSQNYPNPFNSETTISFQVANGGYVSLTIYNVLGRKIKTLFAENINPGYYRAQWNGYDAFGNAVSSGFYYLQMESQSFKETRRIVYLK